MSKPLKQHVKNADWYQPLDHSPSAWMMLKHLGLLLWKRLFASSQKVEASSSIEVHGVKETPLRLFEMGLRRFPLIKTPNVATYTATLDHLNPYEVASLLEEDSLEEDTLLATSMDEDILNFPEETSLEATEGEEAPKAVEEIIETPKSKVVSRPEAPKSLDSIEDINTWILLNIDESTEGEALDVPAESEGKVSISAAPVVIGVSHQTTSLQHKVENTQASIDALVDAYFSQTV
jgi:hypothetical protein